MFKNSPGGDRVGTSARHLNSFEKLPLFRGPQPHCSLLFPSALLGNVLTADLEPLLLLSSSTSEAGWCPGEGLEVPTEEMGCCPGEAPEVITKAGVRGQVGVPGLLWTQRNSSRGG